LAYKLESTIETISKKEEKKQNVYTRVACCKCKTFGNQQVVSLCFDQRLVASAHSICVMLTAKMQVGVHLMKEKLRVFPSAYCMVSKARHF
jgi:hypothetical protein